MYFTQIGFAVITKSENEFLNKFLLSLLNSTLLNFYHKYKFLDLEKDLFQKVLIANCKALPIIKTKIEKQQPFIEKVDLLLSLDKELQESSTKFQRSLQRKFELDSLPKKLENW